MDDCYFYYYSSCVKGDACPFRHEPSALGKETVCNFWKQGKCARVHCNFRHMDVVTDRSKILCYWETQPGGCRKPHCPFMHMSPSQQCQPDNGKELILPVSNTPSVEPKESDDVKVPNPKPASNFDPLVVNFEEESDSESVPSVSPLKRIRNTPKTLELIQLEKIQAESAAFYNYENQQFVGRESTLSNLVDVDCRQKILESRQAVINEGEDLRAIMLSRKLQQQLQQDPKEEGESTTNIENIKVLSLQEIREKRRRKQEEEEREMEANPQIRLPKQRITFTAEEEQMRMEMEMRVSPVKRKIESHPEEEDEEEEVVIEVEKPKKKRRAHSPVVFDVSKKAAAKKDKASKEERKKKKKHKKEKKEPKVSLDLTKFEDFQVTANLSSPSKPTVVVQARKRAIAEDVPAEPCLKILKKEKLEKRPERPLWRPSRLAKGEEASISEAKLTVSKGPVVKPPVPKIVIRPKVPIHTPRSSVLSTERCPIKAPVEEPVPTLPIRKIRLKRPAPPDSPVEEIAPVKPQAPAEEPHLSEDESCLFEEEPSTSKLTVEIPQTPPRQLSHSISIDDEFDLLSPCSDSGLVRTTDEKIFEDIDALLNE